MFHHQIAPPRLTRILIAAAAVLIIASHVTTGLSGDEKPKAPAEKIETFPLEISVSDQDGVGIPGVTIRPYALRASAEAGTHYFWQPDKHGSTENHKTDADGKLILNCPKYVIEKLEIGQISVAITHPDYISLTSHLGVKKPAALKMQRGRKYFVTAIDSETGEAYKTNLGAQLSGDGNGVEWKLDDTGTLSSVAVSPERPLLQVFHVRDDGRTLFSDPFEAGSLPAEDLECYLPDMLLYPGREISGRIDDSVPRPIKEGHVGLLATNTLDDTGRKIDWSDWTKINEDGTFCFSSVPRNQTVMMLAICRGYISAAPTLEELDAAKIPAEDQQEFTMSGLSVPMVARSELDITDFVFPMLPTASVKITVLKPDGQPLPNADVSMWPNQCFPGRGSNIIGEAYSTTKALLAPNDVRLKIWSRGSEEQVKALGIRANVNHFYMTKTNESGVAELHTLPAGTPEAPVKSQISAGNKEYQIGDENVPVHDRYVTVDLIRGETAEVEIRMHPVSNSK